MALKESGRRRLAPAQSLFKPMAGIPVQQFLLLRFRVRALGKCSAHSSEPFEIKCLVAAGRGQHTGAALTAWPLPSIPLVHAHAGPGGQLPAALPFCDLLPDVQRLRADAHPAAGEGPQFGGSAQGQSAPGERMAPYCFPILALIWTLLLVSLEHGEPFIQSTHADGFEGAARRVGVRGARGGAAQCGRAAVPVLEAQPGAGDSGEPGRAGGVLTVTEGVGRAPLRGQQGQWTGWLAPGNRKKEKIKALEKLELFANFLLAAHLHTARPLQSIIETPVTIGPQSQGWEVAAFNWPWAGHWAHPKQVFSPLFDPLLFQVSWTQNQLRFS